MTQFIDFKRFAKENKLNQILIADLLGVSQSFMSLVYSKKRPLPKPKYDILKDMYSNIDDYILQEHQLTDPVVKYVPDNVLHIPIESEMEFVFHIGDPQSVEGVYKWHCPNFTDQGLSFVVKGGSMQDTLKPGEVFITSRNPIKSFDEVKTDYLYWVALKNGRTLIRRAISHSNPDMLWLMDDDAESDENMFEVNFGDIIAMFKGRRTISFNLSQKLSFE